MDPFIAIPVEARLAILEQISTLRDLQSAILSSRSILLAYLAFRRPIRQRIFFNHYQSLESELVGAKNETRDRPDKVAIAATNHWIQQLSEKDPYDGLILREILWPRLLGDEQQKLQGSPPYEKNELAELCCLWAEYLAFAYRQFHDENQAMKIEAQTLNLIPSQSVNMSKPWLLWFDATVTSCMRKGKQVYAAQMCEKMWSRINGGQHHSHSPEAEELDRLALVEITSKLCHHEGPPAVRPIVEVNSTVLLAWEFLRLQSAGQSGTFCYHCFHAAELLAEAVKKSRGTVEPSQPHLERIWQSLWPRSLVFNAWSHLLVDNYADRLEGTLRIWTKLQDSQVPLFSDVDLDWSRDIILQLRKKGLTDQSLSFQANIFELLPPTNLQFCAFGRNLSDAYVKSNQIYEAIRVREQVLTTLLISSTIRTSWIMALDGLYKKVGKDDYLKTLSDSMFVENE